MSSINEAMIPPLLPTRLRQIGFDSEDLERAEQWAESLLSLMLDIFDLIR